MKIFLKRDKSSDTSRYIVDNEIGNELYKVNGRYTRSSHHLYVMNGDNCVAKIRDTHLALLRTCYVSSPENSFHITVSNLKSNIKVNFHGTTYRIRGDVLNKSYDIMDIDNTVVACVCRRFSTSTETLEININNNNSQLACIATAVCLDSVNTDDAMALQTT